MYKSTKIKTAFLKQFLLISIVLISNANFVKAQVSTWSQYQASANSGNYPAVIATTSSGLSYPLLSKYGATTLNDSESVTVNVGLTAINVVNALKVNSNAPFTIKSTYVNAGFGNTQNSSRWDMGFTSTNAVGTANSFTPVDLYYNGSNGYFTFNVNGTNVVSNTPPTTPVAGSTTFSITVNTDGTVSLYENGTLWITSPTTNKISLTTTVYPFVQLGYTNSRIGQVSVSGIGVLAITLHSFSGTVINNRANLNWNTGIANNIKDFILQYSDEGVNFKDIATISPNTTFNNYTFTDINRNNANAFYRLKMMNTDGTYKFSNIVFLNLSTEKITLYPNPVKDVLNVNLPNLQKNIPTMGTIYDLNGRAILTQYLNSGNNQFKTTGLPKGFYTLKVSGEVQAFKINIF